jgi:hypothetical protein
VKSLIILALLAGIADAGHCHEQSPIVGREHCGSFGSRWAHEPWMGLFAYEVGMVVTNTPVPAVVDTGTVYNHDGPATYRATTPARKSMPGMGVRQRLGYRGEHSLLVLEMSAAWALDAPMLTTVVEGQPNVSSSGSVFDAEMLTGLHTRSGPFEVGAELGFGIRQIGLGAPLDNGFTACAGGSTGKGCSFSVDLATPLIDLRARVDAWIDPQVTLGLSVGFDAWTRGQTFALTIGYHASVFDGQ